MKNEQQYLTNLLKQMQDPIKEDQHRLQLQKQLIKAGLIGIIAVLCLVVAAQANWLIAASSVVVGVILMLAGSVKNTLNNQQILRQHIDIKSVEQRLLDIEQVTQNTTKVDK